MINSIEDLRSGGELPTGPVSAWPQERNVGSENVKQIEEPTPEKPVRGTQKPARPPRPQRVKATGTQMAKGFVKTAVQGMTRGRVSAAVQKERFDMCKACPAFIEQSKRCSDCGCYMPAKTWIGGNPNSLCPQQKWSR